MSNADVGTVELDLRGLSKGTVSLDGHEVERCYAVELNARAGQLIEVKLSVWAQRLKVKATDGHVVFDVTEAERSES